MIEIFLVIIFIPILSFLFNPYKRELNRKEIFIFFLLLFGISGLRHVEIANDSIAYASSFMDAKYLNSFWELEGRFEFGFQYLVKFIKFFISDEIYIYFIITSFLIQFSLARFIYKNSKIIWLSIFFLITLRFYFFSVSAIRQGLALVACLLAYEFLKKEKMKYFYLTVMLAFSFHYSSLAFLILPLFTKIKPSGKKIIIFGIISLILFSVMGSFMTVFTSLSDYGKDYFEQGLANDFTARLGAIFISLLSLAMLIFIYRSNYFKKNQNNKLFRVQFWSVYLALIINFMAIKFSILIRFYYYFGIFSIVLLPNVISFIDNKMIRNIIIKFWFLISLIFIMIILYNKPEWYNFYPYKFFWEK